MATKEETKEINGHSYYVRQLPPTKALPLKFELGRIFGKALPALLSGRSKSDEIQAEAFGNALESIFNATDPEKLTQLIKRVVETSTRDGKRIMDGGVGDKSITFDDAFSDDYAGMYRVFYFVLTVNFGNFIEGFGLKLGSLAQIMETKATE